MSNFTSGAVLQLVNKDFNIDNIIISCKWFDLNPTGKEDFVHVNWHQIMPEYSDKEVLITSAGFQSV